MSETGTGKNDRPPTNQVTAAMLRRLAHVVRARATIGGRHAFVKLRVPGDERGAR